MVIENQKSNNPMRWPTKKNSILAFLSIFLYKIILDLSYYFVISPVFNYVRFDLNFSILKFIESFFLLSIVTSLMPKSREKLSNIIIWLLMLLSYVPMLTLFAFMSQPRIYMYAVTCFWILVFLLLKSPTISFTPFKKNQSKRIYYSIFIGMSGIVFFLIYSYLKFSFNFDLTKVYAVRAYYVALKIPLAGYLFNWLAYIVNPIFFALFLIKKKWSGLVLIVILQLLLFSNTGMKTFLFSLFFVLVLMWMISRKNPLMWLTIGLIVIILLGMFSYWIIGDIWVSNLFTARTLFVPAQLSFFYYDFFSTHDHTFLSQHHIFSNFLDYQYELNPPHLIGKVYFNSPEMASNNGIYADAYMNFGFIGFVFWGILLTMILKLIDSFSRCKDMRIMVAAVAMPAIALTNGALLTCLLTHGLLLALILLYLLPQKDGN